MFILSACPLGCVFSNGGSEKKEIVIRVPRSNKICRLSACLRYSEKWHDKYNWQFAPYKMIGLQNTTQIADTFLAVGI